MTQPGPPEEESVAPESVADDAYPVKRTLDHIAQTHCSEEGDADEHVHKAPRLHGTHIRSTSDGPVRQSVTTTSAGADASTPTNEAGDFTAQLAALLEKFQSQAKSAAVRNALEAIGANNWVRSDCSMGLRQETFTEEICCEGGSAVCCSRCYALDVRASPPGLTLGHTVQQLLARNRDLEIQLKAYKMAQPSILFGESEGGRWCAAGRSSCWFPAMRTLGDVRFDYSVVSLPCLRACAFARLWARACFGVCLRTYQSLLLLFGDGWSSLADR